MGPAAVRKKSAPRKKSPRKTSSHKTLRTTATKTPSSSLLPEAESQNSTRIQVTVEDITDEDEPVIIEDATQELEPGSDHEDATEDEEAELSKLFYLQSCSIVTFIGRATYKRMDCSSLRIL